MRRSAKTERYAYFRKKDGGRKRDRRAGRCFPSMSKGFRPCVLRRARVGAAGPCVGRAGYRADMGPAASSQNGRVGWPPWRAQGQGDKGGPPQPACAVLPPTLFLALPCHSTAGGPNRPAHPSDCGRGRRVVLDVRPVGSSVRRDGPAPPEVLAGPWGWCRAPVPAALSPRGAAAHPLPRVCAGRAPWAPPPTLGSLVSTGSIDDGNAVE